MFFFSVSVFSALVSPYPSTRMGRFWLFSPQIENGPFTRKICHHRSPLLSLQFRKIHPTRSYTSSNSENFQLRSPNAIWRLYKFDYSTTRGGKKHTLQRANLIKLSTPKSSERFSAKWKLTVLTYSSPVQTLPTPPRLSRNELLTFRIFMNYYQNNHYTYIIRQYAVYATDYNTSHHVTRKHDVLKPRSNMQITTHKPYLIKNRTRFVPYSFSHRQMLRRIKFAKNKKPRRVRPWKNLQKRLKTVSTR